ncbi:MAG: formate dehydrogenase accessory protein FdhE [Proteobacteria bacterium]|nr:formate dehydrogenase accessory protein FdhE [Pseudomonadota bacterium]MBU1595241.1 formate dehydrogenase accessory protein FdhE [Pseudomonadota bacterium]
MQTTAVETPAALRNIEKALSRASKDIPALAPLLTAFGPLLAVRSRLREAAPGWTGPALVIDAERFSQGAFVLAQTEVGGGFEDMSAHLPQAARQLLPVMAQSFPALAAELEALAEAIHSGALPPQNLADAGFGDVVTVLGVTEQTLAFAAAELVRPFVERQAQDLLALVKDLPWQQTCCPICGGAPNMSVLRKRWDSSEFIQAHGGRRFLRCSSCSTEWTHKRVSCPGCGCEEPDGLVVLRDPARPFERADACNCCKTFVLCLDAGELSEVPDPDVAALTMLPLEIQARREGYVPMAEHPWSSL